MKESCPRGVPLVVIGAVDRERAEDLAAVMRGEGAVVVITGSERACLRVATCVQPDIVLLDPRLSRGLLSLLRAHPNSNGAQISWSMSLGMVRQPAA
jgi:CheY-like chemotaxis protein